MRNKRTTIIFFAAALTALLLRPYLAYQLTANQNIAKDPVAVNNLLQRLIKKKDEPHAVADQTTQAILPAAGIKSLPAVILLFFVQLFALTAYIAKQYGLSLRNLTRRRYYLSFSCIRL